MVGCNHVSAFAGLGPAGCKLLRLLTVVFVGGSDHDSDGFRTAKSRVMLRHLGSQRDKVQLFGRSLCMPWCWFRRAGQTTIYPFGSMTWIEFCENWPLTRVRAKKIAPGFSPSGRLKMDDGSVRQKSTFSLLPRAVGQKVMTTGAIKSSSQQT